MKAITLHQPWASLIAVGVKTIETRSWRPPANLIGQRIAIHAGKKAMPIGQAPEIWQPFLDHSYPDAPFPIYQEIPLGAVVASAKLARVLQVIEEDGVMARCRMGNLENVFVDVDPYGDFQVGRWLWRLTDIQPLPEPIAARGYQGLWNWEETC